MTDGDDLSVFPVDVDLNRPNAARVYDYYLGGACNLKVDREFAKQVLDRLPEARDYVRLNRAFLRRVVRYCAEQGIRQFLDLGSGIPGSGHIHEIARGVDPSCRVLYVDNEPVAVAHGELLLADDDRSAMIEADLRDPEAIFAAPTTQELLDLSEPVAVLMLALLHFVPDEDDPAGIIKRYRDRIVPGSYLALSHATKGGEAGERVDHAAAMYSMTNQPATLRDQNQLRALMTGFDIVEPGVVRTPEWRPESPDDAEDPDLALALGVVGHKII